MAYTGMSIQNPLAAPGTLDPSGSFAEINPLPPPGNAVDGTCDLHPLITGHYAAVKHQQTVELGGTISTGGVWVLTFTPNATINGVPIADALSAISITATVGVTETATALGDLLVVAFTAAKTIATVAAVTSHTRIAEIIGSLTNAAGTLTAVGANAGETYTITATPQSGGTATIATTVDAAGTDMQIGVFVAKTGSLHSDGVTPLVRPLQSGDAAASVIGMVSASNTRIKAIDPTTGYTALHIAPGRDVAIIPVSGGHGQWSAYAEAAVDFDDDIWVRVVATGAEIAGAVSDTPDYVAQVVTVTPTAANTTQYKGTVSVYSAGLLLVSTIYDFTSDGSATAAEVVVGVKADIDTPLDGYVTTSGTNTLILTADGPGYTIVYSPSGAGVEDVVLTTAGSNDHVKLAGPKFSRTTTAAGPCAVQF